MRREPEPAARRGRAVDLSPRYLRWWVGARMHHLIGPLAERLMNPRLLRHMWVIPSLPRIARARYLSPSRPWPAADLSVPAELLTVPGIRRDPEAATEAFEQEPLQDWPHVHSDALKFSFAKLWRVLLPVTPRLQRTLRFVRQVQSQGPRGTPQAVDPEALTEELKAFGASIGLSAVGIAPYDPKYTFEQFKGREVGDRVIVCIVEINWKGAQRMPSASGEQASFSTYSELLRRSAMIAGFLHARGYDARPNDLHSPGVVIHYGVESGLGQLGLNGQLLTPQAGSRCRMTIVTTNAPLVCGQPTDYGIPKICDKCQACVRRCPAGAIPAKPSMHRGVWKAKINTGRCFPVTSQAEGCAVCMKVCPVQRYGLPAVLDEYERSGNILGKGSDELEGYNWPLDGKHYGPTERPLLRPRFFNPPGAQFDWSRKLPLVTGGDADENRGLG